MTNDDIESFIEAATVRNMTSSYKSPPPSLVHELERRDPARMWVLRRHVKWVKKHARKQGIQPERIAWWEL